MRFGAFTHCERGVKIPARVPFQSRHSCEHGTTRDTPSPYKYLDIFRCPVQVLSCHRCLSMEQTPDNSVS